MKKRVLVTGITGFAGSHLADYLVGKSTYDVVGTYLSEHSLKNVEQLKGRIQLIQVDLTDYERTFQAVKNAKPDLVFHLAAMPAVGDSYKIPAQVFTNNTTSQIHILEAIKTLNVQSCRILIVSSADVYGKVAPEDLPIDEETPFVPTNTYAVSKIAQDFLGLQYFITYNLAVVRVRPFNHMGPRQTTGFVFADFAKKIAQIEKGEMEPILLVGNLHTKRDFTDVRDIVRGYELLIEKGKPGNAYNIGSGKSYEMSYVLNTFISFAKVKIRIKTNADLLRLGDAPDRICDNSKFVQLTGWQPVIPLHKTLQDTLDYWRRIV
jgi:GDP-4-dehydro-6-deoxy-D-mannose reductase